MNFGRGKIQSIIPLKFPVKLEDLLNYLQNFTFFSLCIAIKSKLNSTILYSLIFIILVSSPPRESQIIFMLKHLKQCIGHNFTVLFPQLCISVLLRLCSTVSSGLHQSPLMPRALCQGTFEYMLANHSLIL